MISVAGCATGPAHQLPAAVGADIPHLGGARRAEGALVAANQGGISRPEPSGALLALRSHLQRHRSSSSGVQPDLESRLSKRAYTGPVIPLPILVPPTRVP